MKRARLERYTSLDSNSRTSFSSNTLSKFLNPSDKKAMSSRSQHGFINNILRQTNIIFIFYEVTTMHRQSAF